MRQHLVVSLRITVALLVLTCGLYPLVVWAVGQAAFRDRANGSFIARKGRIIGSELIGQRFADERFFHSRASASDYDAKASGGTNLGPTSQKLRDSIAAAVHATGMERNVPADAVTASASGLDPHISPENAYLQAPRVARANGMSIAAVQALIRARIEGRFAGVYGEPRVNVLLLNLDIADRR